MFESGMASETFKTKQGRSGKIYTVVQEDSTSIFATFGIGHYDVLSLVAGILVDKCVFYVYNFINVKLQKKGEICFVYRRKKTRRDRKRLCLSNY